MRTLLVFSGLALVLGAVNVSVAHKEHLLANGTTMLVELAPADPRSLIQGDYMRLNYAMASADTSSMWPRDGRLVVRLDQRAVARFVRLHRDAQPLAAGERLLQFRKRGPRLRIGSDAFFFQEGHAQRYVTAQYGELRVSESGSSVLVGLRDSTLRQLK